MTEGDVKKAEQEVKKSTAEFEQAMEHLEETVEDTSQKVTSVIAQVKDTLQKPKRVYQNLKGQTRTRVIQSKNAAQHINQRFAQPLIQKARNQPQLLWAALAGIGGMGALVYFQRKRRSARRGTLSVPEQQPIILEDQVENMRNIERKTA
jgi:hypothetical protein